jgi:hypothetical protein
LVLKGDAKSEHDCLKGVDSNHVEGKLVELVKADSSVSTKKEDNDQNNSCGGESSEHRSPDEEIQDHGEDSTTFSSIEAN